jgi:hypothetical protein
VTVAALKLYSFDTSALIDGLERYYPQASFPALWVRVDELIADRRLYISEEVWQEIQKKDAVARAWCDQRNRDDFVIATDGAVAQAVQQVLAASQRLVMNMKGRNRADPFVIAVAKLRGCTVVTGEGSNGTADRPKIPYVCGLMGIECVRFLDVIRIERWQF